MTSVIILSTDRTLGRQCASRVVPNFYSGDSNDENQLLIVKRNIKLQPTQQNGQSQKHYFCHGELSDNCSHRMHHLKEVPSSLVGPSGMEIDNDDPTGDGEPRMKHLKSNPVPSPSHDDDTDSGISDEVQETGGRIVDVYLFILKDNFALILEKARSCIPNGLIIVPIPTDMSKESEAKIARLLKSILDDVTMKRNKSVPRIVFVSMQSGAKNDIPGKGTMTHIYQLVGRKDRCECSLDKLRHKVCDLLPKFPQCDYTCLEDESYDDIFVGDDLPSDQMNALLTEKKIIRFKVSAQNKYCTCPADLIARFSQATQGFEQYKVETSRLLSEMDMELSDKPVVLAALAFLNLLYPGSGSYVLIPHLYDKFDLHSVYMSNKPNALRFASNCAIETFDNLEIFVSCDSLGWKIKEASEWNNNGHDRVPDVFQLIKDSLAVLMWFHVNIYICEVKNHKTSDRERENLESLKLCLQRCIGSEIKTSICCSYSSESNETFTADGFIQDSVNTSHCFWIDASDAKLYYEIDALDLLRSWISPSREVTFKRKLNQSLNDTSIATLTGCFGQHTELLFTEQGIKSVTVAQIKKDTDSFKMFVKELLQVWKEHYSDNANLYTLRKAIISSQHHAVDLIDFDKTVGDYLRANPRDSLI